MTDEQIELIAAACHQQNRAWCIAHQDITQPHWSQAPVWQRESAIAGVKGALAGNTPEESHESWLAVKRAEGWVYGVDKDPVKKTHPCMRPYKDLPPEQQAKDSLFVGMVRELAAVLDE